jgi:hypothetical protein
MKLASDRAHRLSRLLGRSGSARRAGDAPFEHLEGRQMLALTGVTLTSFPLEFYNASGVLTYDAASQQLDVNATPTGLFLADGPHPISATHGDFQIHARVGASGQLLGGVAGDDFIYRGTTDLGSGPVTGDLLTGEIYAFGFFDSGGPTDQYDYRFVVTGGLLAPLFAGRDIGVIMTSENSTFANDFSVNFGGKAKGTAGPIATPVLSSIAGNVYYDQNNDGVFQNTESPIPGALVTLTGINDAGQAVNLSTNTLGDGSYFFGNLRPGTYKLTETQPAGYLDGKDTIGTPGGTTTNDMFSDIALPAGYNGVENNFGEILAASIAGNVYYDANNDGVFQNTESPIPGTQVTLTGTDDLGNPVNQSTNTLADGSYYFGNLRPGDYKLTESQPAGYLDGKDTIGTPGGATANDMFSSIKLDAGVNGVENNFGEILASSISGYVYHDANDDGIFQNTENPIPGTQVTLTGTDDLGNPVSLSTNTLADGSYSFGNLRPGTYKLTEFQPAGYLDGKDTIGTPGGSTTNDMFSDIVLPAGFDGVQNNFGEVLPPVKGKIRGTKYLDLTGNGLTPDDTGFGGVTIYIDYNNDGVKNSNEPSTITASDGSYEFGGLNAGNYIIREVVPNGYIRTFPVLTDRYVVTLSTGQTVTGINFANAEKGCDCFTISNVYYVINGTKVVTDLRGNTNQGDEVTVWFTLSGNAPAEQFTLVSYTAPGSTFVAADAYLQEIYDLDTGFFAAGTHSLSVVIPDSYYQIDFVCGAAIDTFGPAGSNIFYTPQMRLISADNDGNCAVVDNASSISGSVYLDRNNNGLRESSDSGLAGVKVTLTGTDYRGRSVSIVKYTRTDGTYTFGNLARGTYKVTESDPSGFEDGIDSLGSLGGTKPSNDVLASIALSAATDALSYNFGERPASYSTLSGGDTQASVFWRGGDGQALIRSLNGSSGAKNLGNWLASNFPNLFGSSAGSSNNLANKTNSQVASAFAAKFDSSATKVEAEILATALSVFVSSSSLAGGNYGAAYGFIVTSAGISGEWINVGSAGSYLGVSNNSKLTVFDLLKKTNSKASNGTIFSGDNTKRSAIVALFDSVNESGALV